MMKSVNGGHQSLSYLSTDSVFEAVLDGQFQACFIARLELLGPLFLIRARVYWSHCMDNMTPTSVSGQC